MNSNSSEIEINKECWKRAVRKFTESIQGKTVEEAETALDMLRNEALYVLGIDAANAKRLLNWNSGDVENHLVVLMLRVKDIMLTSQRISDLGEADRLKLDTKQ